MESTRASTFQRLRLRLLSFAIRLRGDRGTAVNQNRRINAKSVKIKTRNVVMSDR